MQVRAYAHFKLLLVAFNCMLLLNSSKLIECLFSTSQTSGLIFLNTMSFNIVYLVAAKYDVDGDNVSGMAYQSDVSDAIVATSVFTLSLYTMLLGFVLVFVGRIKLASFVSYLPMPVVGGYLAFIGFFCLEAGISVCTGKVVNLTLTLTLTPFPKPNPNPNPTPEGCERTSDLV
jgi:MFS superfamily sulfate permease-like transporter